MIITSTLGAMVHTERQYLDDEELREHGLASILQREIIGVGERSGAFIRPESVWVDWDHPVPVPLHGPFVVAVRAYWSPDPREGVELRGGPLDGDEPALQRQAGGRPFEHLILPLPGPDLGAFLSDAAAPVRPMPAAEYRRAGIDSERDRWVYLYRGER